MAENGISQPRHRACAVDHFLDNLRPSGTTRRLHPRHDHLGPRRRRLHVPLRRADLHGRLGARRYRFAGKGVVLATILGTLTLPYFVVVIPQFIMVARDFGLDNTWFALIVPPLFNSLGVLFMRQTFPMMPHELFDAARVEGVKEWRIFLYIGLPLARPALAALSIILFLHSWNNYLWPLLINSKPAMMTAPVALGSLIGLTKVSWGGIMVGAVILTAADARSVRGAAAPFRRRHLRRRGQVIERRPWLEFR